MYGSGASSDVQISLPREDVGSVSQAPWLSHSSESL